MGRLLFNHVASDISVVLSDTTLIISGSIETGLPVDTEIVRVASLITTEITEKHDINKGPQWPWSHSLVFWIVW